MKTQTHRMTLDEALRPLEMHCGDCGSDMVVYPDERTGTGVCPKCSPVWLDSFARFVMNQMRQRHGLEPIE